MHYHINTGTHLITTLYVAFVVALVLSSAHSAILPNRNPFFSFPFSFCRQDSGTWASSALSRAAGKLSPLQVCFWTPAIPVVTNCTYEFARILTVPGISSARRQKKYFKKLQKEKWNDLQRKKGSGLGVKRISGAVIMTSTTPSTWAPGPSSSSLSREPGVYCLTQHEEHEVPGNVTQLWRLC